MAEEPSIDLLIALARGGLPVDEANALRSSLAGRPDWREAAETVARAVEVLDADAVDLPPAEAISRAKALGRRLGNLAPTSLVDRVGELVARLVRDTRLDLGVMGLRGNAGFACRFSAGADEIEIECCEERSGSFQVAGQVSGDGWQAIEFESREGTAVIAAAVDEDGMFVAVMPSGIYSVRLRNRDGRSIRVELLEIP